MTDALPNPERLYRPIAFERPDRISELSAWIEHTPFAMWMVEAVRPTTVVELGSHAGVSYCAFAQAVKQIGLATSCYAIDTWQGDEHTSKSDASYAGNVYEDLRAYHDPRYGSFSTLIRSTFEEAVSGFADGSIDLLHIDGYHTYEAVRGDFETWLPKLSRRAVVLFHDINERGGTFGAWRFWDEVKGRYPSFDFLHGHGLGVLAVGPEQPEQIRWLTGLGSTSIATVRDFFAGRGLSIQREVDLDRYERRWRATEKHADNMTQAYDAARAELAEANRQLQESKATIALKVQQVSSLQDTEGRLVAQIRGFENQIRGIETSTSWRLTKPIRVLGRMLGGTRRLVRSANHRITLSPSIPIEANDTPLGHADWYDVTSHRGRLPTRWVSLSYDGPAYDGAAFITLYANTGGDNWQPFALPPIRGKLQGQLLRLPDQVVAMKVMAQGSHEALSGPPEIRCREIGQAELAATMLWRQRARLPNALRYLARHGVRATASRLATAYGVQGANLYHRWIESCEALTSADRAAIAAHIQNLEQPPLISVVVPVYNTSERHLREMMDSVMRQIYPHWELCIADDASTSAHVRRVLEEYAARDKRVKLIFREKNGHISAASNSALELAGGTHVALLDHDDLLAEHALYIAAIGIVEHPDADVFYSDEDKINDDGMRTEPYFKPDYGLDLLLGQNYVSHLGIYRLDAIKAVGGFRLGYEGSQDYDLVLRILARTKGPVVHLPWVLYHWRLFPGAGTFSSTQIDKASESARRAIREHLTGKGVQAKVEPWVHAYHRVIRDAPAMWPKVSAIVPTRDHVAVLRTCVSGLLERTDYPDIELIIANNDSAEPATLAYFEKLKADPRVRILDCPGPFNFSAINNAAVRVATGEIVLLLNNDIEMVDRLWLKEMVKHAMRPEVGAVGAKLLYPDNTIQHGGVVLGLNGVAGHLHAGVPAESPGYFGWLKIARNSSAVTAACMALRRSIFDEVGGLDEANLKVAFNDVDFCLRVTEKGYEIIWTPEATLYHWESKSRGNDLAAHHLERFKREIAYMRERWGGRLDNDPFFNPNLSLATAHPVMAFPPRRTRPWQAFLKPATAAA